VLPDAPDAVLLDLDGTLSDAGPAIVAALEVALAHVGHDPLDPLALRAFVGPPLEDTLAGLGLAEAVVEDAVRVYRANYDLLSSPLYDGVVEALEALRGAGLPLALATSKPQAMAEAIVAAGPLAGLLDHVAGSDRPGGRLTKADVVAHALGLLGGPSAPVMVGDRLYDVQGSAAHGVPCVGVLWGYGDEAELVGAGAAALVAAPPDLVALLTGRAAAA
jgi:phosphoglycolate phosphatase